MTPTTPATEDAPQAATGRVNQKKRTRDAIVRAASDLMLAGREVTMPEVAKAALVSEATAYRYFPDLPSLLVEAMADKAPDPAEALAAISGSEDPVERVGAAARYLLRLVQARQGAVRTMIAATITRPGGALSRPGLRFGLIDQALAPLEAAPGAADPARIAQLKLDLAVVISAEALFALTDLHGMDIEDAIASITRTATTLAAAAVSGY